MWYERWKLVLTLVISAALSYWILEKLTVDEPVPFDKKTDHPDQYMENFTTLKMDQYGQPEYLLEATYMAFYSDDDTTEVYEPELTVLDVNELPIVINADKGWITSDNNVILLERNVHLQKQGESGEFRIEVIAEEMRILIDKKYAETDKPVTLISRRTTTHAVGAHAYLEEQRIELLENVQTIIRTEKTP